jgi:hypothetical protein
MYDVSKKFDLIDLNDIDWFIMNRKKRCDIGTHHNNLPLRLPVKKLNFILVVKNTKIQQAPDIALTGRYGFALAK